MFRSIPFPVLISWRCLSAWVRPVSVTSSNRHSSPHRVSSLLMRSMPSDAAVTAGWAEHDEREQTLNQLLVRDGWIWSHSKELHRHGQRRTVRRFWILRFCVRDDLTVKYGVGRPDVKWQRRDPYGPCQGQTAGR